MHIPSKLSKEKESEGICQDESELFVVTLPQRGCTLRKRYAVYIGSARFDEYSITAQNVDCTSCDEK